MTESLPFALLRPVEQPWLPEIDSADVLVGASAADVQRVTAALWESEVAACDLETRGTDTWKPETAVIGVALAWRTGDEYGAAYFDIPSMAPDVANYLFRRVTAWSETYRGHLVNHNTHFDIALWAMELRRRGISGRLRYTHCTYGLYKQLAGESWEGQSWGLKPAQVQLLRWPEANDAPVDDWLVAHGYHESGPKRREGEAPDAHLRRCREWECIPKKNGNPRPRIAASKGEMWRVPPQILGKYALLDCFAALQLYEWVLRPVLDGFPELEQFHCGPWMRLTYILAEQQYTGIRVDRPRLEQHGRNLQTCLVDAELHMRADPVTGPRIAAIEAARLETEREEHAASEPPRYNKKRDFVEPPRLNKDGSESAKWKKWAERVAQPPTTSARWTRWEERRRELAGATRPPKGWSPASADDMLEMLFDSGLVSVGYEPERERGPKCFWIEGVNGRVVLECTDSGLLSVDYETLMQLPEWGAPLREHTKARKELSYVESYLELLWWHPDVNGPDVGPDDEPGTWRIHPGWVVMGTVTGRLAGKEPSLHQIPKSLEFLECFLPDEDAAWVEMDWSAVEPHVLAEMSRDAGLLALYGPDAKPHDRYLFSVAHYPGALGDAVRAVYDVENPTPESVAAAKKACKRERAIGKTMVLSGDYKAGWQKQHRKLMAAGVRISEKEARELNAAHKKLHRGVFEEFGPALKAEWHRRGGYVLNGLGHPICIYGEYLRDAINRVVQSTAHSIHVIYVVELARRLHESGIEVKWIVADFHDQFVVQVDSKHALQAVEIARHCVTWINEELGTTVRLKGEPRIVANLADAKDEEGYAKKYSTSTSWAPLK